MRRVLLSLCSLALGPLLGCTSESAPNPVAYVPPAGFVTDQRIIYSDGLHNENTEMLALDDRILLIFRGGETGQIGSDVAHINVYASMDGGQSFQKQSEVSGAALPGMRDIRDPKLVMMNGKIYLYAISRLPGGHYRDLSGHAWTVRSESTDKGVTWSDPEKTFTDVDPSGNETYWGFWRYTKRTSMENGVSKDTLFATGYDDDDIDVGFFASDDGITWEKRATIVSSYDDVPSEAELQFFGDNQETAVSLVRMDNQGILQDGQTAICTAHDPFTDWECGRRIEQRLDGPTWISPVIDGVRKNFVVARKHLPCTFKRTAVYELRGDLTDPGSTIDVCETQELASAGDTAYTALAPLGSNQFLMSWYSSVVPKTGDTAWLAGTYAPSDIWLANLDLAKAGSDCHAPPAKTACPQASLTSGDRQNITDGTYLLTVAPVIYPANPLYFQATLKGHDKSVDVTLAPLDAMTLMPADAAWETATVPVDDDGQFTVTFASEYPPESVFPLLADPFLELQHIQFSGVFSSKDGFCGNVTGNAQVLGTSPSDAIDLRGSTFGAARITGATMPKPIAACAKEE